MTELSPAAQAVLDAVNKEHDKWRPSSAEVAASVLETLANMIKVSDPSNEWGEGFTEGTLTVRHGILEMAAELRGNFLTEKQ